MIIKPKDIKLFINHYKDMPSDFNLSLSAGKVDEAGDIAGGQAGAINSATKIKLNRRIYNEKI